MPKFADGTYVYRRSDDPPVRYWVSHCHKKAYDEDSWEYSLGGVRGRGKPGFHFGTIKEGELEFWIESCEPKAEKTRPRFGRLKTDVKLGPGFIPSKLALMDGRDP